MHPASVASAEVEVVVRGVGVVRGWTGECGECWDTGSPPGLLAAAGSVLGGAGRA